MNYYKPSAGINPLALLLFLSLLCVSPASSARAQSDPGEDETTSAAAAQSSAKVAGLLASSDPLERRHAAEELARTAATEQLRLVSGYRLQEKDARVRLALDWALYRMGKTETLFDIVRNLNSSRRVQAATYLAQLEGPEPLYVFLERVNDDTKIPLLEVLARLGDEKTLERINPYASSYDPRIANAAQFAIREITRRQSQHEQLMRPRQTGKSAETEQEEDQTEP
ncbi:MAG TPA: hypothetical protein VF735_09125 [Pyrinomonadaceae bacterium]|jgi:hypothetical protein